MVAARPVSLSVGRSAQDLIWDNVATAADHEQRERRVKKLINAPDAVVADALRGIEAAHGDRLRVSYAPAVIIRADAPAKDRVALVSGGGAGHEPLHGGFVGPGMLDAACPGEIFTSPTPDQMAAAISAVDGGAGVVQIVKNYTGDVMNFEMAAELATADGHEVETVLTNDDVAVEDSTFTAGRRGVGVTVLVEKICGGAATAGLALAEVVALGRRVNAQGRSMGLALTPCITPTSGLPSFELGDDEVEIGIGIHGEPGRSKEAMGTAAQMAQRLMGPILEDLPFASGDRVLAFVNGMGGTPLLELYVVYAEVARIAAEHGLVIERNLVGNYITSLEMQGCSITLLRLDDELVRHWDAPVDTVALRWGC
jgi:dihydroxyacetone kinase-like protein